MKIPLMCQLFGHKLMHDKSTILICERCDHTTEWPADMICRRFGHWFEGKFCVRCGERVSFERCPGHQYELIGVSHLSRATIFSPDSWRGITVRTYRCKIDEREPSTTTGLHSKKGI